MKKIKLIIKGRPASKKNSRIFFHRGGRGFSIPSKAYKNFHDSALFQLQSQNFDQGRVFDTPVRVTYLFKRKGNYNQDLDNAIASVNDVLQDAGILANDKLVAELHAFREQKHPEWETVIEIEEITQTSQD